MQTDAPDDTETPDPRCALEHAIAARAAAVRAYAFAQEARKNAQAREDEALIAKNKADAAAIEAADRAMDAEVVRMGGWPVPERRPPTAREIAARVDAVAHGGKRV